MPVCSCIIRCDCLIRNLTSETLEAAPEYLKKDAVRWNSAAQLYEEMQSFSNRVQRFEKNEKQHVPKKCRSQYHSPERSPMQHLHRHRRSHSHLFLDDTLSEMPNRQKWV